MVLDKVKTLSAAERYLETGKIPAAIKEYCKIVEAEPNDFTTLNILGDLQVRVGNNPAAILCFRRMAEHYREQDFALKAIAIFKKIDRLQPNDVEIVTALAELYAQQDLVVEARAHYLAVANAHAKSGATQAGLEILCKIADLDPQNTQVRIRLAEGYANEGMVREAAAAFTVAGQYLVSRGALEEALDVFKRSLILEPGDHAALEGLLAAHTARGTADEAAEIIARECEARSDDLALVAMLARAYLEAEDPEQAEKTTAALVAEDASAYLVMTDVARLYLRLDKVNEAVQVMGTVADQILAGREERQLFELINEALTCDSDNVSALRLLVRTYWWQRDVDNLKAALERLAEAAQAAGQESEERYALTQLCRLAPDLTLYVERLNELGGAEESAAAEVLPDFEEVVASEVELDAVPKDEHLLASGQSPSDETVFDWNTAADPAELSPIEEELAGEREFSFETVIAEELPAASEEIVLPSDGDEDRHAAVRAQELESVDFYIAQGYIDIAVDTLNLLESQFGQHADIDLRRQRVDRLANGESIIDEFPAVESAPVQHAETSAVVFGDIEELAETVMTAQVIDPGLAEIFEEYRVSAEGESNGNGDYETHYNLGLAYQEMDLFEEAVEEFQLAVSLVSAEDGTPRYLQCCNLIGQCFLRKGVPQLAVTWFIKGLSAPTASEDERQALRFDLAAAYEQAGELNRALDLFTEVYGMNVSYRGVNERLRSLQSRITQ
jgi:tetratricopeptide (TPR) repeat protein